MKNAYNKSLNFKKESNKRKNNNLYRNTLIIISFFIIFFVFLTLFLIFYNAINGFSKFGELNFFNFLFGNYYDGIAFFAGGFMVVNTIFITLLSLSIAAPISIFTALFITKIVNKNFKPIFVTSIFILSAIPTVIYGSFGLKIIDSLVLFIFPQASPGSILSIVLTLSFMIMPTMTVISMSSINSVDKNYELSSLSLGATRSQTSFRVVLKSASKGLIVAAMLGAGRALGESTAVSMVASQTNIGPSFGLLSNIRLLTITMLQGFSETAAGTLERSGMFALGMLLIITILLVILSMKMVESKMDLNKKTTKSSNQLQNINKINKKFSTKKLVSSTEQKKYLNYMKSEKIFKNKINKTKKSYEKFNIFNQGTIQTKGVNYKKRESKKIGITTLMFSFFGLVLLTSIIIFLFNGGTKNLNWDYISAVGVYQRVDYGGSVISIYGLYTPIFGTVLTIVSSLIISVPFGLLVGITISIFLNNNSKFAKFLNIFIDLLTGIPSLIYGIVGSIIFLPLFSKINLTFLSGTLIMSILVLPTIIKSTINSLETINKNQMLGSLSLGATKYISVNKVLLRQFYTDILSSTVLASGIILADSAIFVVMYGTLSADNGIEWMEKGGTTLSTEIYKLTKLEYIPWEYIKTIGIIIVSIILSISMMANFLRNNKNKEFLFFSLSFLITLFSIFLKIHWLFIFGILMCTLFLFLFIIFDIFFSKKIKIKINEFFYLK